LAAPPVEVEPGEVVARDVILVLDVSGSMRGEKMEQARAALQFVLDSLNDEDRFNVITFSTSTQHFARGLVPASQRGEAQDFVARLEANGSTDINRALLEALAMVDNDRPAVLVFLTDGLPTVGEVDVERIIRNVADAAPANARIFPFGVGYDVNTALLDTVAQNHRGASGYVRPEESIEEKVSAFYAKVSTPLLADLELDFGRVEVYDLYPYPLPDLFAGTQLVVVGRYQAGGDSAVTLAGEVNGRRQATEYGDLQFSRGGGDEFIARLWATRKIGYLLQQVRLSGEEKELVDEIVDLSVRYGIVTPYTSFLVEEPELALREAGRSEIVEQVVVQATALPAVSGEAAVDRSSQEKQLFAAEAPMAAPTMVAGAGSGYDTADETTGRLAPVRHAGDKTFVLHEGIWTDTTFDPERMETLPVAFGSDDYFALVAARPEWGRYFALGSQVIVVLEGTAYEVQEGEAPPLDLPAAEPEPGDTPAPTPAVQSGPEAQAEEPPAEDNAVGILEAIIDALRDVWNRLAGLFRD
jgi:Ca-activated chloride channel family protein